MARVDRKYVWLAVGVSIGSIATGALLVFTVVWLSAGCGGPHEIAGCM